jgi:hypothetical protein
VRGSGANSANARDRVIGKKSMGGRLLFLTLFVVDLLELFVVVSRHFFSSDQITDG